MIRALASPESILAVLLLAAPLCALAEWESLSTMGDTSSCRLQTEEIRIFDGYGETRVRLHLDGKRLRVATDSNIDGSFDDLALQVDQEPEIPADGIEGDQDVVFESAIDEIVAQFIRGTEVAVLLRFWPTYPPTDRHAANFSLIGFTKALQALESCQAG
jgi:hypothetical protein